MNEDLRGAGGCYPVWFRADLPREFVADYWRAVHSQICADVDIFTEYRQHHFAVDGHGFWPGPAGVGTAIPADWRMDGLTENRFDHSPADTSSFPQRLATLANDEQNIFDRVTPKRTTAGGNCWWTGSHNPECHTRAVILLRARAERRGESFGRYLEEGMVRALLDAGAPELRSHVFDLQPDTSFDTPNVLHDEPANRVYDGALIIGAASAVELTKVINMASASVTLDAQREHCVAIHAYMVAATYLIVTHGRRTTEGN